MSVEKGRSLGHYCQATKRSENESTATEHILLSDTLRNVFESYLRLLNQVFYVRIDYLVKMIIQRCRLVTFGVLV